MKRKPFYSDDSSRRGGVADNVRHTEAAQGTFHLVDGADEGDDYLARWHKAAADGDVNTISSLILSGVDIGSVNKEGNTALHIAASKGHAEAVSLLLEKGVNIEARGRFSQTALHMAVTDGHTELAYVLIDRGAMVDARNMYLWTPLHMAANGGYTEIVELLLNSGADVEAKTAYPETALHVASREGNVKVVSLLLRRGAFVDSTNKHLWTALHSAANNGDIELVSLLTSHGAAIDLMDENKMTPLAFAAMKPSDETVRTLIAGGANINQKLKDGDTILSILANIGLVHISTLILDYGADLESRNQNGQTPFLVAVKAGHLDMVSILIDKGAHIEAADDKLLRALHLAAMDGNMELVDLLFRHGAQVEARTMSGDSALHIAVEFNYLELAVFLIDHGADLNSKNNQNNMPIHIAILEGHADMLWKLMNLGAAICDAEDKELALCCLAAEAGHVGVVVTALNKVSKETSREHYMNTMLLRAVKRNNIDAVICLLDIGASIDAKDDGGLTPLFIVGDHSELMSILIHQGANIESRNERHQTVVHHYAALEQIEALRLVLSCECDIQATDDNGDTALHHAAYNDKRKAAALLIEKGIDIDSKNIKCETALYIAITHGFIELAELLLKAGISMIAKESSEELTALHLAVAKGNLALILLLLNQESIHHSLNAKDKSGRTPLHYACLDRDPKIVKLLLGAGMLSLSRKSIKHSINAKDESGRTPLHYACLGRNPKIVTLLLDAGTHMNTLDATGQTPLQSMINEATKNQWPRSYVKDRDFIEGVNLLLEAGVDTTGVTVTEELGKIYPKLANTLLNGSRRTAIQWNVVFNGPPQSEHDHMLEMDASSMLLKEFRYTSTSLAYNHDERQLNERQLNERQLKNIRHKYGRGFPQSRILQPVDGPDVDEDDAVENTTKGISSSQRFNILHDETIDKRANAFIASLFQGVGVRFFVSDQFFMLESNPNGIGVSPKWALQFDCIKGIIRERGRLIVQVPPKKAAMSIPGWHRNNHPILSFIDAVYVCRRWSKRLDQEAFSDVLGGSENQLATHIHAMLIAGLSVLSIANRPQLVNKLITAVLGGQLDDSVSNALVSRRQVSNRIKCGCSSESDHRPLSAIAAAKAVGFDIWRKRQVETVTRVWDLEKDTLVQNMDAFKVIFITHRWRDDELEYADVTQGKSKNYRAISIMSEKLQRIRNALLAYTRYVWIDSICIDKSNLSELDEAIRSMYKWYASCRAVVLEYGTPLSVWRKRGWCLQEGAAAGVLCGISKEGKLVSIYRLAIEQKAKALYPGSSLVLSSGKCCWDNSKDGSYGEGLRSRERLLYELAIQKGDISFLSFPTTRKLSGTHLPAISDTKFLISKCVQASTPATVSHLGISIEVQLISGNDAKKLMERLSEWKSLSFVQGKYVGLDQLFRKARKLEFHATGPVEIAIIHNIRSVMLVEVYGKDRQTGGGRPLKICSPIQCCQIEENEFKTLFIHTDVEFERIWLGDKSVSTDTSP